MRRTLLSLILGCLVSFGAGAAAPAPADLVKAVNDATTREQYTTALQSLGFTADELAGAEKQSSGSLDKVSIYQKDYFSRAEAFDVDLEGLGDKETVVQVAFHVVDKRAPHPSEGEKVYFIAVLDSKDRGYAPLARKLYAQDLCLVGEKNDENAMSFAFKPIAKKKFKQIVFHVTEIEACALQIETSSHGDTLAFDGKTFVFTKGESQGGDSVDRMDPESLK